VRGVDGLAVLPERTIVRVEDEIQPEIVRLRIVQHVDHVRPVLDIGVSEPLPDARLVILARIDPLALAGDVAHRDAAVAAAALARRARHQPHDTAVIAELVHVEMAAVDEDRLEVGRRLGGAHHLHGGEIGNADHSDIAVAPGLLRHPLDQVVDVLALAVAAEIVVADELAVRAAGAAHVRDHVGIAACDHGADIAGFDAAVPQRARPRLRRQRQRERLQFLAVGAEREQRRHLARCRRPVDVGREVDAVAHRDAHILLDRHRRRCGLRGVIEHLQSPISIQLGLSGGAAPPATRRCSNCQMMTIASRPSTSHTPTAAALLISPPDQ
jgi:hypothetical protein